MYNYYVLIKNKLNMVVYTQSACYLGGWSKRITWVQEFEATRAQSEILSQKHEMK
jgi:hypothetical protein